jgi:uncharacterized protein
VNWVDDATILRSVVGSGVHGIALAGTDDHDEMGVCIEPVELVVGLQHFEQYEFRTAEDRARHDPEADQRYQGKTPPSQPGDTDLVIYSLRKYAALASAGNPSILVLMFAEPVVETQWGYRLRKEKDMFASREAGKRFLGYLKAQRERMLGTRGQMRVTRTELVEKYGYDTKYAAHAIRLGIQGIEYISTGKIALPMELKAREACLDVKRGRFDFQDVIDSIEELEEELKVQIDKSPLPKQPDRKRIDKFIAEAYLTTWSERAL